MLFYIIFGTNLLTGGPAQNCCFLPISEFRRKRISNGMKPLGELFFGINVIQGTWSTRQEINEVATRQGGAPDPCARPHPRGPLVAPSTDFFCLYIPIYPKKIKGNNRSGVPPPQASVATKNQSGPCSGTLPEGGSLTDGHLHHPGALHDEEGVVHPRG